MKRATAAIAGSLLLAALGLFCVSLANGIAFGFNAPLGAKAIAPIGMLLASVFLACCSFAVRFGLKTVFDQWHEGAQAAKQVHERLKSEHARSVAFQESRQLASERRGIHRK